MTEVNTAIELALGNIKNYNQMVMRGPLYHDDDSRKKESAIYSWINDNSAKKFKNCLSSVRDILKTLTPQQSKTWIKSYDQYESWNEVNAILHFNDCLHKLDKKYIDANLSSNSNDKVNIIIDACENKNDIQYLLNNYENESIEKIIRNIQKSTFKENGCTREVLFWDNWPRSNEIVSGDIVLANNNRNESAMDFIFKNRGAQSLDWKKIVKSTLELHEQMETRPKSKLKVSGLLDNKKNEFISSIENEFNKISDLGGEEKIGAMLLICIPQKKPFPFYISSTYGLPLKRSNLEKKHDDSLISTIHNYILRRGKSSFYRDNDCYEKEYITLDKHINNVTNEIQQGRLVVEKKRYFGYKEENANLYPQVRFIPRSFDL